MRGMEKIRRHLSEPRTIEKNTRIENEGEKETCTISPHVDMKMIVNPAIAAMHTQAGVTLMKCVDTRRDSVIVPSSLTDNDPAGILVMARNLNCRGYSDSRKQDSDWLRRIQSFGEIS